ncbi:MAG: GntR family transcriptional regulator [Holophagales bacterium]|nr:GntR family transcriptional regulator [Holophagales bacterium]
MEPKPPQPKLLRQWVTERIRADILEGRLRAGEWLRQEQLAQRYEVSQMPVREALKQLISEGLVRHEVRRGARVVSVTRQDVADLYACRALVEGMAARSAAVNVTDEQLVEMRKVLGLMKSHLGSAHIAEYRELNRRFHSIISEAAPDRSFLSHTLSQIWSAFPSMLWSNVATTAKAPLPGRGPHDVSEHEAILIALEKRDADAAEKAVRAHIEEAGRLLLSVFEETREP